MAPQATPMGRAPLSKSQAAAVAGHVLQDAVPQQATSEGTINGLNRGQLLKSIEGAIRSDKAQEFGITTAHYQTARTAPFEVLGKSFSADFWKHAQNQHGVLDPNQ